MRVEGTQTAKHVLPPARSPNTDCASLLTFSQWRSLSLSLALWCWLSHTMALFVALVSTAAAPSISPRWQNLSHTEHVLPLARSQHWVWLIDLNTGCGSGVAIAGGDGWCSCCSIPETAVHCRRSQANGCQFEFAQTIYFQESFGLQYAKLCVVDGTQPD